MATLQWISRLAEFIEDWNYLIRRDGWRGALPAIGQELVRLPYRHMKFFIVARSLLDPLPDLQPKTAFEIREFGSADLDLVRHMDRPSEARLCARRLAHGHKGLLALHKGQPAGYAWASDKVELTLERVHLKLKPGDMICVDAYTFPAFRRQGVQTALALARFRLFRDMGYQRAVTYIEVRNYPSLHVWQKKMGSQVIGHVEFVRIGPWRQLRYSDT
jgi:GNAT superfamily N-acetyltransferase